MIAKHTKAREFWNISMTVTLDLPNLDGWPEDRSYRHEEADWKAISEDGRPWRYIFCSEELPEFCRLLLKLSKDDESILLNSSLYIDINSAIGYGQVPEIDSHVSGRKRLQKLLDPLRHLHSFGAAQIDGPLSGSYKGNIIKSVCSPCATAGDIILATSASLGQADQLASRGQMTQAKLQYKVALSIIRSCVWRFQEQNYHQRWTLSGTEGHPSCS